MKTWTSIVTAAAACGLLAGEAAASIPPPNWKAPLWTGPAKVCGEAFALDARAGEKVVQAYPSVGLIRYGVTTANGRVEIAEYWNASPPEVAPEAEDRKGGKLRPLIPQPGDEGVIGYLFQPEDEKGLPVRVLFTAEGSGAWTGKALDDVLKRIDFGRTNRGGCTEPTR